MESNSKEKKETKGATGAARRVVQILPAKAFAPAATALLYSSK